MPIKLAIGIGTGGGIVMALLIASCIVVGILAQKARDTHGAKLHLPRLVTLQAKAIGFFSRWNRVEGHPPPGSAGTDTERSKRSTSDDPSGTPVTSHASVGGMSAGRAVPSTALQLLTEKLDVPRPKDPTERPPDFISVLVDTGAHTAGRPSDVAHNSFRQQADPSAWDDHSGKIDSARSLYSLSTGLRPSRTSQERTAWEPEEDNTEREGRQHEELWTRGVDPSDVEVMRDTSDQPVVLGRGAYAVVYLGRWQATLVAVKVMLASDSDAAQREAKQRPTSCAGSDIPISCC